MSITPKENFRMFYTHHIPEWLPDYRKDRQGVQCSLIEHLEHPRDPSDP